MAIAVTRLSYTPVKGTRLLDADALEVGPDGARGDRRFVVIDARDRMVNGKTLGALTQVVAEDGGDRLTLRFPDGVAVEGPVRLGPPTEIRFYSRTVRTGLVDGPFSEALSRHVGRPLRLVSGGAGVDRGRMGGVSLVSRASLDRLAAEAGERVLDARRFRMLLEVDGLPAHAEDRWVGRTVAVGEASVRFHGHVGCLITSRDPESGEIDLPTLDVLGRYRREDASTEPLPFGIYGEVVRGATVRVGDPVVPLE